MNLKNSRKIGEKIIHLLFLVVAVTALVLGIFQLRYHVDEPFLAQKSVKNSENSESGNFSSEEGYLLKLAQQDSDSDSLSDYDEIYVYNTSAYLEDSDSDGYLDQEEIATGHDPNCPAGKNCGTSSTAVQVPTPASSPVGELNVEDSSGILTELQGYKAQEVRELLRAAGIEESVLAEIDDKTLMELYEQTFYETVAEDGIMPADVPVEFDFNQLGIDDLTDLENLSGTEIRDLLEKTGLPANILTELSDVELKEFFDQTLEESR